MAALTLSDWCSNRCLIKVDVPEEKERAYTSLSSKIHERQGVANIEMIAKIAGTTTAKQHVVKKIVW